MTTQATTVPTRPATDSGRWVIWAAGLVVALGAAVATAHGLYEVAIAATVPGPIAWLYPLITDGLALVAYASTTRLTAGGRRYAWAVVVLAAGLSGLAQASYLAIGVHTAPAELRAGVGAWPAVAAAITAHLLYLLASVRPDASRPDAVRPGTDGSYEAVQPVRPDVLLASRTHHPVVGHGDAVRVSGPESRSGIEQLSGPLPTPPPGNASDGRRRPHGQQSHPAEPVPSDLPPHRRLSDPRTGDVRPDQPVRPGVVPPGPVRPAAVQPVRPDGADPPGAVPPGQVVRPDPTRPYDEQPAVQPPVRPDTPAVVRGQDPPAVSASDSPGDRARAAALAHRARHGVLPTVSALMELAGIGRGTAGAALKQLRDHPAGERAGLHVVHDHPTGTSQ